MSRMQLLAERLGDRIVPAAHVGAEDEQAGARRARLPPGARGLLERFESTGEDVREFAHPFSGALAPLLPPKEDTAERQAIREARKARKAAQQAEARQRREQHNKARNRA